MIAALLLLLLHHYLLTHDLEAAHKCRLLLCLQYPHSSLNPTPAQG
jgi:hypothetical protein